MSSQSSSFAGRTRARSQAVQLLFQAQSQGRDPFDVIEEGRYVLADDFDQESEEPAGEYAQALARGVARTQIAIDRLLQAVSDNWNLTRMPLVDRDVMAVAVYEMFEVEDIPTSVAISEAVELSKVYGTDESSAFVNGILGRIARLAQAHPEASLVRLADFADETPAQTSQAARRQRQAQDGLQADVLDTDVAATGAPQADVADVDAPQADTPQPAVLQADQADQPKEDSPDGGR